MVNHLIIFISSFILLSLTTAHEFHVSKCLVEFNSESSEIQISINIFIDDLETALSEKGIVNLYIGTGKEDADAEIYIKNYLDEVFIIGMNNSSEMKSQFIGKEVSEDLTTIWCYMSIPVKETIRSIYVKNAVLLKVFEDQKNITSIVGPAKEKCSFMSSRGLDEKIVSY